MRTNQIVAGALYDFIGRLTSHPTPITVWAAGEAHEIMDVFREWAADRGLDIDEAAVIGWSKSMQDPRVEPFETRLSVEDLRKIEQVVERVYQRHMALRA